MKKPTGKKKVAKKTMPEKVSESVFCKDCKLYRRPTCQKSNSFVTRKHSCPRMAVKQRSPRRYGSKGNKPAISPILGFVFFSSRDWPRREIKKETDMTIRNGHSSKSARDAARETVCNAARDVAHEAVHDAAQKITIAARKAVEEITDNVRDTTQKITVALRKAVEKIAEINQEMVDADQETADANQEIVDAAQETADAIRDAVEEIADDVRDAALRN